MNRLSTTAAGSRKEYLTKLFIGILIAILIFQVYWNWTQLIVQVVELQRDFHGRLATHIKAVAKDPEIYGWALIALSFAYGVFHAVGPGHGKAVIATYLGTHRESMSKGIGISMITALLQSIVAIILVIVLAKVLDFRFADINRYGEDLALVSYVLIMLLGLMLSVSAIHRFFHLKLSTQKPKHQISHQDIEHSHDNDPQCGCQHAYAPEPNQTWLQTLAVVFSVGIRPCSGAVLVLIYAHLVGVFHYGIAATLVMGLGTGLAVSAIALGSQFARHWFERIITGSGNNNHRVINPAVISISVRLAGGALLILMGWGLYQTALRTSLGHPLF